MKRVLIFLVVLTAALAWAKEPAGVLPKVFAGWRLQTTATSTDAANAEPAYATLLKEYGFVDVETAHYEKPGRTMSVKVARFKDASGAYGAFTFYRTPKMAPADIGDGAASNNDHVLFFRGNLLLDVKLDQVTATSAGELRELASDLPLPPGNTVNLPSVTTFLPKQGMVENTTKYVEGPIGLATLESPLPADMVDFNTRAEIASALYKTGEGEARLMVISYPTPALAGIRLRSIEGFHPAAVSGIAPTLYAKRSGPLVAVVSGAISPSEAKTLLASVDYEADVTWNQNTHFDKRNNMGYLLINIAMLIGIIFGFAIVAGLAFGGFRIIMKRMFPDRVFDRSEDVEIIRLNIGK